MATEASKKVTSTFKARKDLLKKESFDKAVAKSRELIPDEAVRDIQWTTPGIEAFRAKAETGEGRDFKLVLFERMAMAHPDKPTKILMYACGYSEKSLELQKDIDRTLKSAEAHLDLWPETSTKRDFVRKAMTEAGVNIQLMAKRMVEGLGATRFVTIRKGTGWDSREVPDHQNRYNFLELAMKASDVMPSDNQPSTITNIQVNIVGESIRSQAYIDKLGAVPVDLTPIQVETPSGYDGGRTPEERLKRAGHE